jgi:RHS repeat-associated protein
MQAQGLIPTGLRAAIPTGASTDEPLLLERFDPTAGTTTSPGPLLESLSYHADHQGSVRWMSDAAGAVANEYDYDSYGRPNIISEAITQPFLYTGREYDRATGLYYYRARYYDPETGTFTQDDPIHFAAGDLNVSRYVWNNPLNWNDPSGLAGIAARSGTATATAAGSRQVAKRVICQLTAIASILDAAIGGDELVSVTIDAANMICGAKTKKKKGDKKDEKKGCKKGGLSFPAGTEIWTENGFKPIEGIVIGDLVYSRNEETGENELKPVTETFDRISRDMVVMELKTPTGEMATVRATPEHPFMTLDGGWIHAGSLKAGDFVFDIDGAAPVTVESISFEIVSEKVYNFEVAELHNYFVGDEGVLVHNGRRGKKCGCERKRGRFNAEQNSLIQMVKGMIHGKGGVSPQDAAAILQLAAECKLDSRGPEAHRGRPHGQNDHIHVEGVSGHIFIK